jgi:multidrug efflux system membrane fusion protein
VDVARAMVAQGEANVVAARLNLEFCTIVSPIDGRAGQKLVDMGNMVMPNPAATTTLLVIQRQDPVYADFTISERDLPSVKQAIAAGTLKARVHAPGEPNPPREAPVTFLDNAVQDGTGTVKLRALVQNGDRSFWPGQFVDVKLVLAERSSLVVPATAIQIGQNGPYVYGIKADSTAEIRPVTPGQRHGDLVAIEKGLSAGDRVIVTGQLMVYPTGKVSVLPPAGTAPPPGAPK